MGKILIATSGYSYDDWKAEFYPEGLGKNDYLRYYSINFPFVELNFSYYAMPKARGLVSMMEKTPGSFLFAIKAHKSLSHEPGPEWRMDAAHYAREVSVLAEKDRLAAVLIQFPYSFHYEENTRRYLAALLAELKPFPLFVEFRNNEWEGERVLDELEKRNTGIVMLDRPELKGLPDKGERVLAEKGYLRLHGRNTESWWSGDNKSRYDYLYSAYELNEIAGRVRRMAAQAKTLLVAFNNHAGGKAVKNARELKAMLEPWR